MMIGLWLSDSTVISDNECPSQMSVVRFISDIGHLRIYSDFRIHQRYSSNTDQASSFSGNDLTCLPRMGLVEGSGR